MRFLLAMLLLGCKDPGPDTMMTGTVGGVTVSSSVVGTEASWSASASFSLDQTVCKNNAKTVGMCRITVVDPNEPPCAMYQGMTPPNAGEISIVGGKESVLLTQAMDGTYMPL